jgi:hypothetical protein
VFFFTLKKPIGRGKGDMEKCEKCHTKVEITTATCTYCGHFLGPPNVREVQGGVEVSALQAAYAAALEEAAEQGRLAPVKEFERLVGSSSAVVSVSLDYLCQFLLSDSTLYANYYGLVEGGARKAARVEFDRRRRVTDDILFASYATNIRFAALSLNCAGLTSYGDYTMVLADDAINERATVLDLNSYQCVVAYKLTDNFSIPPGHRSVWGDRDKLAVSKLAKEISSTTQVSEYASILLKNTGDKERDDFIEVHIWGTFNNKAVKAVAGKCKLRRQSDKARIEEIKELLAVSGRHWEEL